MVTGILVFQYKKEDLVARSMLDGWRDRRIEDELRKVREGERKKWRMEGWKGGMQKGMRVEEEDVEKWE